MIILIQKGEKALQEYELHAVRTSSTNLPGVYETTERIEGTALFLIRDAKELPFYITQTMFYHGILYEDNILVSIIKRMTLSALQAFKEGSQGTQGVRQMGYMEVWT